nr:hypothetical protein [Tanacetum cinerariifolium]
MLACSHYQNISKQTIRNKETKKVQKTLRKQQYKNFTGSSSESLDQIHDRLQKLISHLEVLGESLNKTDLEDQSLDDLFNSLKIYEAEVKSSSSASTSTQNIAFVSSQNTDSTNEPVSAIASVSAASAKIPIFALPNVDTLREGYHVVTPPYTGTFMPPKPDLIFHDAPNVNETIHTAFNVELSPTKPDKDLSPTHRPSAPIIEDWVSDSEDDSEAEFPHNALSFVQPTEQVKTLMPSVKPVKHFIPAANLKTAISKPKTHGNSRNRKTCFVYKSLTHLIKDLLTNSKLVPLTAARPVTTAVPQPHVTRPRPAKTVVTKPYSPPRRTINHRPSPTASNFSPQVTTVKAPKDNDKGVIDSGCSRHMIGNMSYLTDFKEINGGYVSFASNSKGGKISDTKCIVLSPEFKLPDENQVLLRVHRENNMYNVDLKNIVPSGNLTCLFIKATLDESNLWHRRLGHINFKTMNKLVKVKEPEFKGRKPESEIHVSPSSSAKTKKHDDKTKREAKGKSPVELSTGYRNLSAKIEDFSDNSINEVNTASTPVPTVGQISTNNTNTFTAAGPSNTAVSLTLKESSYMDPSQYTDDLNMPALEGITYSDDEEDVGVEADFSNLETTITVSPIIITKVHKDHPVTQIISDLSLATQTRSMTRMVKDQGGLTQIN